MHAHSVILALQCTGYCSLEDADVAVLCQHATQLKRLALESTESKLTEACLPAIQEIAARHILNVLRLRLQLLTADSAPLLAAVVSDRKCSLFHLTIHSNYGQVESDLLRDGIDQNTSLFECSIEPLIPTADPRLLAALQRNWVGSCSHIRVVYQFLTRLLLPYRCDRSSELVLPACTGCALLLPLHSLAQRCLQEVQPQHLEALSCSLLFAICCPRFCNSQARNPWARLQVFSSTFSTVSFFGVINVFQVCV